MAELNKLVMQAQAGDLDAYGTLVRLFQDMAVGFAHSKLGDFHLAEDAAQEAFIHAYLDLAKLRRPAAFPGWLRRIVATYCRRQRRKKQVDTVPLEGAAEITASVESPAKLLEQKELSRSLQSAVQALPEDERTVTYLFYFGEVQQKDIAAFLEIPLTTVKYRLHTSRKLKEQSKLMLKSWWRRPEVYLPFLIMVGDRPAGFAVVEAPPAAPDGVNYYLYHFSLHHPYRDKGVAEKALKDIFERFRGQWELNLNPKDVEKQACYRRALENYIPGKFKEGTGLSAINGDHVMSFQFDNKEKA